jgi:general secretion pathway protein B
MSYILEALRRSQAERERGRVPGLDAQLATAQGASKTPRTRVPVMWLGAGLGVGLMAAVAAAAWRLGSPAPAPAPAPAVAVLAQPPQGLAAGPGPGAAVVPAAAETAPVAVPSPSLPVVVSAPVLVPPKVSAPVAAPVTPATPRTPAAGPAGGEPRAIPLAELTAEQRRDMPPMAIGGSIWSENAASRFVMVNGQVVHEGEPAGAGVTVERIGQKATVLRWRELRIEVPF